MYIYMYIYIYVCVCMYIKSFLLTLFSLDVTRLSVNASRKAYYQSYYYCQAVFSKQLCISL